MPEATPVPAPVAPKKRSKVPFVIAAVVVFGLLALVAGGFAIYQFVYLPHTAREFVAATESKSKEANAKGQEILAEINVFYSDKEIELVDSQDAITAFEQKNAELKQLVDEQAQGLPAASPATAELRNALEAYYQAHDEFSHVYTHYNEYLQALIPPLNNTLTALTDGTLNLQVNTLADIDTAISVDSQTKCNG